MLRISFNFLFVYLFCFFMALFLFMNKSFFGSLFFVEIFFFKWMNLKVFFFFDVISLFFLILSGLLLLVCFIKMWFLSYLNFFFFFNLFFIMLCLIGVFISLDFFLLFFSFEMIVIPLFLMVGMWGSRESKMYASYMLFLYTMFGSMFALFILLFMYYVTGSSNFFYIFDIMYYLQYQLIFLFFLFMGFSVKVPMFPFHSWLPEAHVEAPTAGSVILAGIILKLGFYVYMSLMLIPFGNLLLLLIGIMFVMGLLSLYVSSISALVQIDMKKMIAYSSMSHMNFALVALFCGNFLAMMGSFFMMFGHAVVSSALFSSVGMLYDSYKNRLIFYYGGLVLLMPIMCVFFFVCMLGNFSMPGTINFVGEILMFVGIFCFNSFVIIFFLFGMFLTLVYSLFLYTRVFYGLMQVMFMRFYSDMISREFLYMFVYFFFVVFFGLFPYVLFDFSFSSFLI